eukprot:4784621-Prymnesium_polylepis.1
MAAFAQAIAASGSLAKLEKLFCPALPGCTRSLLPPRPPHAGRPRRARRWGCISASFFCFCCGWIETIVTGAKSVGSAQASRHLR